MLIFAKFAEMYNAVAVVHVLCICMIAWNVVEVDVYHAEPSSLEAYIHEHLCMIDQS